jgi:hypothetical protein
MPVLPGGIAGGEIPADGVVVRCGRRRRLGRIIGSSSLGGLGLLRDRKKV